MILISSLAVYCNSVKSDNWLILDNIEKIILHNNMPCSCYSTCQQIRKKSTRKATQVLTDLYLKSNYVYKVRITGSNGTHPQGYKVKAGVVLESYGGIHVDNGMYL